MSHICYEPRATAVERPWERSARFGGWWLLILRKDATEADSSCLAVWSC